MRGERGEIRTFEPLHPVLRASVALGPLGEWIDHPLYVAPFHSAELNAFANGIYAQKKKAVDSALKRDDIENLIWLHERKYRLNVFSQYVDRIAKPNAFEILGRIWIDTESASVNHLLWESHLPSEPEEKSWMMMNGEWAIFEALPDEFEVFRGISDPGPGPEGLSWTLDPHVARWFAERFNPDTPAVYSAVVDKKDVAAYLGRRGEKEILLRNTKAFREPREVWSKFANEPATGDDDEWIPF